MFWEHDGSWEPHRLTLCRAQGRPFLLQGCQAGLESDQFLTAGLALCESSVLSKYNFDTMQI